MTKACILIKHISKKKKKGMYFKNINIVRKEENIQMEWCKIKLKCKLGFDHREPEMKILP